jgi:REP element-mobilizing transposase RayT
MTSRQSEGFPYPEEHWACLPYHSKIFPGNHLSFHPDLVDFTIRYHVVLCTRQRVNVFSSEHGEQMADLVRQGVLPFEQTTAHVVWLASDHLHLYIDASPEYALDEIVHAIREYLEHEVAHLFPALPPSNQPVWERAYFAESIG